MGGTNGKKGWFPSRNLPFWESFVDTNEGLLGNGKGIYKAIWLFDKGGMNGWGAKWEKNSFPI
jgi:hypothetical protein